MKIATEAQRLAHPQARLIPNSVMRDNDSFNDELPDSFIPLMKLQSEEQLFAALRGFRMPVGRNRGYLWLAVAFSHPNLSKEKLLILARQLDLSPQDHLFSSIALNRQDNLEFVMAQDGYSAKLSRIFHISLRRLLNIIALSCFAI